MKKVFLSLLIMGLTLFGVTNFVLAQEGPQLPSDDPYITNLGVTLADDSLEATTNYTITFTTPNPISAGDAIAFSFQGNNCFSDDPDACAINYNNADVLEAPGTLIVDGPRLVLPFTGPLAAGAHTFTLTGIINAQIAGSYMLLASYVPGGHPQEGFVADTVNFYLGDIAFVGTVVDPDGDPVSNTGVSLYNNQGFRAETGIGQDGAFVFPVNGVTWDGQSYTITPGDYLLEVHAPMDTQGVVAPGPTSVTYAGSTVNVPTIHFTAATKTISGSVTYPDGSPVPSCEVSANKGTGGGHVMTQVDGDGNYTLLVGGGTWNLFIQPAYDPETGQQVPVDWNWMPRGPTPSTSFANDNTTTEVATINFEVTIAGATIKGFIKEPDGSAYANANVEIRSEEGMGQGARTNEYGYFEARVPGGTYKLEIFSDPSNPESAKYYLPETMITVGEDETKDLGTLTLGEKTSKIMGTVTDIDGALIADIRMHANKHGGGSGWGNAMTGDDGTYTIWLQPGEWGVEVDTYGNEANNYINTTGFQEVSIGADETVSGVDFVLKIADASISITAVNAAGDPLTDIYGYAYARKSAMGYGPGNEFGSGLDRGTAQIPLEGGDTYLVGIHMPPENTGYSLDADVEVTVAVNEQKAVNVTLLPNDATISGYLKDQDGNVITGVEGEVYVMDDRNNHRPTFVKDDGTYSIDVKGGRYYNIGFHISSTAYLDMPPMQEPFLVGIGETKTKIITVFKATAYISGILLDPDGAPVQGYVHANNHRSMAGVVRGDFEGGRVIDTGTKTNYDGVFTLPIVAGTFNLNANMPSEFGYMPPEEREITLVTGETVSDVILQFRQPDMYVNAAVAKDTGETVAFGFCHAWATDGGHSGAEVFDGTARVPLTLNTSADEAWYIGCDSFNPDTRNFFRSPEVEMTITAREDVDYDFVLSQASYDLPPSVTETFSATQPKVMTLPDGTTLNIPANALASEGNVTVIADPNINLYFTEDSRPINFAWNFEALDSNGQLITSFTSAVVITISYDQDLLDTLGIDEGDIVAKYYDETSGAWVLPDGVNQDTTNDTISFSVTNFTDFAVTTGAAGSTVGSTVAGDRRPVILTAPDANGGPRIIASDSTGTILDFMAYESTMRTGYSVTMGDIDGDNTQEIIVSPHAGVAPLVRVFNQAGTQLYEFYAYATTFRGGVSVAAGDVDADGKDEIVTMPYSSGGANCRIFGLRNDEIVPTTLNFFIFPETLRGGFSIAMPDMESDGKAEIVVAPLSGGSAHLQFYGYRAAEQQYRAVIQGVKVYDEAFHGGVTLGAGDVDGDGDGEVITGVYVHGGPHIQTVYRKSDGTVAKMNPGFMAFATQYHGGVNVAAVDWDRDGTAEIAIGTRPGDAAYVRVFDASGSTIVTDDYPFGSTFLGGVALGSGSFLPASD